jgi:hypothetical protein
VAPQAFPTFQPTAPGAPGSPRPYLPAVRFTGEPWQPWQTNPIAAPPVNGLPVTGMDVTPTPFDPTMMDPSLFNVAQPMAPPPEPVVPQASQLLDGDWSVPAGDQVQMAPTMQPNPIASNVYRGLRQMGKQYGLATMTDYGRNGMNGFPEPVATDQTSGPRPLPPLPWEDQPTAMELYRQQQQSYGRTQRGPANPALARFPHLASLMGRFGR